jgi:hypothetical protein
VWHDFRQFVRDAAAATGTEMATFTHTITEKLRVHAPPLSAALPILLLLLSRGRLVLLHRHEQRKPYILIVVIGPHRIIPTGRRCRCRSRRGDGRLEGGSTRTCVCELNGQQHSLPQVIVIVFAHGICGGGGGGARGRACTSVHHGELKETKDENLRIKLENNPKERGKEKNDSAC